MSRTTTSLSEIEGRGRQSTSTLEGLDDFGRMDKTATVPGWWTASQGDSVYPLSPTEQSTLISSPLGGQDLLRLAINCVKELQDTGEEAMGAGERFAFSPSEVNDYVSKRQKVGHQSSFEASCRTETVNDIGQPKPQSSHILS